MKREWFMPTILERLKQAADAVFGKPETPVFRDSPPNRAQRRAQFRASCPPGLISAILAARGTPRTRTGGPRAT